MTPTKTLYTDVLLFPAAAVFSIAVITVWVPMLQGWLAMPALHWHGHEMLFGYALVVLAGYLIVRASRGVLALLFALWLAARIAPFAVPDARALSMIADLVFASAVIVIVARPFLRAAKKIQNRVFAPLLMAVLACDAVYQLGALRLDTDLQSAALSSAIDLYTLLLLLMGGRVIPAVVAGYFYRKGQSLEARVQPPLEKAALALMVVMIVLDLFVATQPIAGLLAIAVAVVSAIRIARWRLWTMLGYPQVWALALGYAWLVPGLALKGWAQLAGSAGASDLAHALTVGALGTLTLSMMARKRLQREPDGLARFGDIGIATLVLSAGAILRVSAAYVGPAYWQPLLSASSIAWVIAFAILLYRLLRAGGRARSTAGDA